MFVLDQTLPPLYMSSSILLSEGSYKAVPLRVSIAAKGLSLKRKLQAMLLSAALDEYQRLWLLPIYENLAWI